MKAKFALALCLSVATFAGTLVASKAQADDYPNPQCMRECRQEYNLCMTYTPDKAALCEARRRECIGECGAYL